MSPHPHPTWTMLQYGLERAILLIPACHLLCGIGMAVTEGVIHADRPEAKAARHALVDH